MTAFGILVEEDTSGDQATLTMEIPLEQKFAKVIITGEDFDYTTTYDSEGGIIVPEYNEIGVGKAILDTEVGDITASNLIVVGGPCVNTIAATLMGLPSTMPGCYEQFPITQGEGLVYLVDNGEKVAMIVAGYTAQDTRNAAKIIANFEDHEDELTNVDKVIVRGNVVTPLVVVSEDVE